MSSATQRFTVAGTAAVIRFNWPKYVAVVILVAAAIAATLAGLPRPLTAVLWLAGGTGLVWTASSVGATWWIYDHRRVYDRVGEGLGRVGDWASVHVGFDDATSRLASIVGQDPVAVIELSMHASPSLRRARATQSHATDSGAPTTLPVATSTLDSVFVTFAAHEIRDRAAQGELFGELRRVLRPDGRLIVTEHLRDIANVAVYGPGAFHFQPAGTWIDRAAEAGFELASDVSITPFVHRMLWNR